MSNAALFRVLVVDDNAGIRVVLEKMLTAAGYEVELTGDGRGAISILERQHFDLVLTDIIMPSMDGVETLLEVRKRWPDCKVIAMSGGGRVGPGEFLVLAERVGADATIGKPFQREAMLQLLRHHLPKAAA